MASLVSKALAKTKLCFRSTVLQLKVPNDTQSETIKQSDRYIFFIIVWIDCK